MNHDSCGGLLRVASSVVAPRGLATLPKQLAVLSVLLLAVSSTRGNYQGSWEILQGQ